ncbi:MAG: alpha/beta fold hydrolase [Elusimicrobia bacterium]|nr:alpha/beta fold hydrolase [Elusimicrobiota bacterium]
MRKSWLPAALSLLLPVLAIAAGERKTVADKPKAAPKPAAKKVVRKLAGEPVELKTADGWTLAGVYLAPKETWNPVFILLHETGGRKENWHSLASVMVKEGIGYLAIDLRGHGGSQNPPPGVDGRWPKFRIDKEYNEWNNMVHDVEAAVAYLNQAGVKETQVSLGGADVGSSIALRYAAIHKEAPSLLMLSPSFNYREVLTVNAVRAYGKRPILMVVAGDDKKSMTETGILYQFARMAAGPDNAGMWPVDREHGTKILNVNPDIPGRIVEWMKNPQKAMQMPDPLSPNPGNGLPTDQELGTKPQDDGQTIR